MPATCQQCKGYDPQKCAKGYPFYGYAHMCLIGFDPVMPKRLVRFGGIVVDRTERDVPLFFRNE